MPSRRACLFAKHFTVVAVALIFIYAQSLTLAFHALGLASSQQDTLRTIVSDDFTRNRPKGKIRRNSARKPSKKPDVTSRIGRSYRLASYSSVGSAAEIDLATASQVGLTFWKLRRAADSNSQSLLIDEGTKPAAWIAERVEADTEFHEGDYVRLSLESPRAGYLYVINRDWLRDDDIGETNLIFPIHGDDNKLYAGKLIDIPGQTKAPFKATPKPNQLGEILTIIVTSSPLELPISEEPLPISNTQLMAWEEMWRGPTKRFELENGVGQVRTAHEQQAAARKGTRQLTREDPPPQTIYVLSQKNKGAVLFNVHLSYGR